MKPLRSFFLLGAVALGVLIWGAVESHAQQIGNYRNPWAVYYFPNSNGYWYQSGPTPPGLYTYANTRMYGYPSYSRFTGYAQPYAYPASGYYYPTYGNYSYPGTGYSPFYGNSYGPGWYYGTSYYRP